MVRYAVYVLPVCVSLARLDEAFSLHSTESLHNQVQRMVFAHMGVLCVM